jgi:hypothetical protein
MRYAVVAKERQGAGRLARPRKSWVREGVMAIGIGLAIPGVRGVVGSRRASCVRYANKNCLSAPGLRREAEISLTCTAQCTASNRPLPGAETALILYHRYSCGSDPPGERSKAGFFPATYVDWRGYRGKRLGALAAPTIISE